ncbi:hypothetical protein [Sorangium cellulosum]|nr:hypothetical protein [Sorangium cellulosum]
MVVLSVVVDGPEIDEEEINRPSTVAHPDEPGPAGPAGPTSIRMVKKT